MSRLSPAPQVAPRLRSGATTGEVRGRIVAIYAGLIAFNILVWAFSLSVFHGHPVLMGSAILAYTFGLRHAVDADHIAAIDNVTRKLMQGRQRPVGVGLFFSLGHSSVVVIAFVALAVAASALESRFQGLKAAGALVGISVSVLFLFAIAAANIVILIGVRRSFQRAKRGGGFVEEDLDMLLANRGLIGRALKSVFGLIGQSWHMYPLGFLFGLGFDTATEIAVLGLSGPGVVQGVPIWQLLAFPAMFTAGMTLVDTTDSVLMLGAYGWAFVKPIRKLYYNLTITTVSVIVALGVGGIETLGVIGQKVGIDTGFWGAVAALSGNFGALGWLIVGLFVACWLGSALNYYLRGYDRIEISAQ